MKFLSTVLLVILSLSSTAFSQLSSEFDTHPLMATNELRVGIVPGSFDPPTEAHRDLILKAIETLKLDKIIVAVNVITAKDFNTSVDERIEMTQRAFAPYTDKVMVVPRSLDGLDKLAEVARAAFKGPFYAVLGEDVFIKNYELLKHIPKMQFAAIPRQDGDAARIDLKKFPNTVTIDAEFPGISSSKARAALASGRLAESSLPVEVQEFLQERSLFKNHTAEMNELRAEILRLRITALNSAFQSLGLKTSSAKPAFKPQQSAFAQVEKVVRDIIEMNALTPAQASAIRKQGLSIAAKALNERKVGVFRGSFDPINTGQLAALRAAQEQLKLDSLLVTVIDDPTKTYNLPVRDRIALVKAALQNDPTAVVVPEASEGAEKTLRIVTKELARDPRVILGENVFAANYRALRAVEGARFVVVMRTATGAVPTGSDLQIRVDNSEINSKNLTEMLADPEKNFPKEVWTMIKDLKYLGVGI